MFSADFYAQQFSSGYFVHDALNLSMKNKQILVEKVKLNLASSGINISDGFHPLVTSINYLEYEIIEIPGVKKMYRFRGEISLSIVFVNDESAFHTISSEITAVAGSLENSQTEAIRSLKFRSSDIQELRAILFSDYSKQIENYSKSQFREAQGLYALGKFSEAIVVASGIPIEFSQQSAVDRLIDNCAVEIDKEVERYYKHQQDSLKAYYAADKVKFELEKQRLKNDHDLNLKAQKEYTERLKNYWNSRANVDEFYAKVFDIVLRN